MLLMHGLGFYDPHAVCAEVACSIHLYEWLYCSGTDFKHIHSIPYYQELVLVFANLLYLITSTPNYCGA